MTFNPKPCPFCGDPMRLWDHDLFVRHTNDETNCPIRQQAISVSLWNTRHPVENDREEMTHEDYRLRYMGQIMAECDCSQEAACQAAGRCLAEGE